MMILNRNTAVKFLLLFVSFFYSYSALATSPCGLDLYMIKSIDRLGTRFIIEAERNDSIFKIVSIHDIYGVDTACYNPQQIQINMCCKFELEAIYPINSIYAYHLIGVNTHSGGLGAYDDFGNSPGIVGDEESHYRVYYTKQLHGLYYLRPKE